jgi:hypothetical protein
MALFKFFLSDISIGRIGGDGHEPIGLGGEHNGEFADETLDSAKRR